MIHICAKNVTDKRYAIKYGQEYLHKLNIYYKRWFSQNLDYNVLEIDTNNFNIFNDRDKFDKICNDINFKLDKL